MIDKTNDITDSRFRYRSPKITEISVNVQSVLCMSGGNDSMREYDYGNGGFSEE